MATEGGIPESIPDDAQIAQFTRIKTRIGFENGSEETFEYDDRVAVRDDEIHFRQYTERNSDQPLRGGNFDLKEDLPQRTILRVNGYPKQEIQYRRFIEAQRLYLVTFDAGRSVRIVPPDQVPRIQNASQRMAGTASAPEPEPEPDEEEFTEVGEWEDPIDEAEVEEDEPEEPESEPDEPEDEEAEEPEPEPDELEDEEEEVAEVGEWEPEEDDEDYVEASVGTWDEDDDEDEDGEEPEPAEA